MDSIERIESYAITVNGRTFKGFEKESTWNGLICYKNRHGVIIAVNHESIADHILNFGDKVTTSELVIVMSSPFFQDKKDSNEHTNKKD